MISEHYRNAIIMIKVWLTSIRKLFQNAKVLSIINCCLVQSKFMHAKIIVFEKITKV